MALLSRKADYALLILSYLHQRTQGACARAIAERFQLKPAFAANVLKLLCRQGFVRSQRGIHGGYILALPAQEIVLSDLLERIGEPFHLADCNTRPSTDSCGLEGSCPIRRAVHEVDRRIRDVLRTVTLADLAPSPEAVSSCSLLDLELLSR